MLLIPCPWCGERDEVEFSYGGEAGVRYPDDPAALSDEEWARYLFFRANPRGALAERWVHTHGCRRWFELTRDTVTHVVGSTETQRAEAAASTPPEREH